MLEIIDRNESYNRFYIQHHVPRFNNASSTFDNDQYLLEIIVAKTVNPTDGAQGQAFTTFVNAWLNACGNNCGGLETFECGSNCTPVVKIPAII
jgi:hypothetical protein